MHLRGIERVVRIPDWHLTTAEILYHLPDHPGVLQSFIWQKVDRAPGFPELHSFLEFWRTNEAAVHADSSSGLDPRLARFDHGNSHAAQLCLDGRVELAEVTTRRHP
jgi:uncharacterized protein Usg